MHNSWLNQGWACAIFHSSPFAVFEVKKWVNYTAFANSAKLWTIKKKPPIFSIVEVSRKACGGKAAV